MENDEEGKKDEPKENYEVPVNYYEVDAILGKKRIKNLGICYLVKWQGF